MKALCSGILRHAGEYVVVVLLLSLHWLFISKPKRHATVACSNLMTNVLRLESCQDIQPHTVVLAGSSITGRLLSEFFQPTDGGVMNLGLDGCGSMEAAAAVVAGKKFPGTLLIEINTVVPGYDKLYARVTEARSPVRESAQTRLPWLAAKERPMDLMYDQLRRWKDDRAGPGTGTLAWSDEAVLPSLPQEMAHEQESKAPQEYYQSARKTLQALRDHGVRMAFVLIPADGVPPPVDRFAPAIQTARELGREFQLPVLDLRKCGQHEQLSFTDGVHLTPAAARMMARLIETEVVARAK